MSTPSPSVLPSVVARLRAAGCVFAEDEARLLTAAATTPDELTALVQRRADGLPLEHVLGWVEFLGLRIAVNPGVFVPRRRTEFLVRQAAALAGRVHAGRVRGGGVRGRPTVVVDLCCGTGAVGVALAALLGPIELHVVDIDPAAVRCARRNVGGAVYEGDLYAPLPADLRGHVDVLVANAPYVPTGAISLMPPEARVHEARVALDGGTDGLDVLRRVAADAGFWLAPGGHLLVEAGEDQAPRVAAIFADHGLAPRVASSAQWSATVVVGTRSARHGGGAGRAG